MSDFVNFWKKVACFGVLGSPSALIPITKNLYDDILILLAQNEIYVITNKMIPNTKNLSVYKFGIKNDQNTMSGVKSAPCLELLGEDHCRAVSFKGSRYTIFKIHTCIHFKVIFLLRRNT